MDLIEELGVDLDFLSTPEKVSADTLLGELGIDFEDESLEVQLGIDGDDAGGVLDDLGIDVDAIPSPRRGSASSSTRLPEGVPNPSVGHMTLLARHRWSKLREENVDAGNVALKKAWNSRVLRAGDEVEVDGAGDKIQHHANTYSSAGVLKLAFKTLACSHSARGEVDIEGSRRPMEIMLGVGALITKSYARAAARRFYSWSARDLFYLRKQHDATPMYLQFGEYQSQLLPQARYLKKVEADRESGYARWVPCSYAEYAKLHPRIQPNAGILEVFGHTSKAVHARCNGDVDMDGKNLDDIWSYDEQQFVHPPSILTRATASTLHAALFGDDDHHLSLSFAGLQETSAQAGVVV